MVIGVGNAWRGDDAAGLAVARRLRTAVDALEHEGDGAGLLEAWRGCDDVVVIDAATSSGAAPGTLSRFDAHAGPLPARLLRSSTHAFGLADAVELARALGRLPRHMHVYAIEGSEFSAGAGLSSPVAEAVERLAAVIAADAAAGSVRARAGGH